MRINEDDSDKLIMTRPLLTWHTRSVVCIPRGSGNYAAKILHRSGITSAITIIINQIYRATKAKNLLTRETKKGETRRRQGEGEKRARTHTQDTYTQASEREKERRSEKGRSKGKKKRRGINRSLAERTTRLTGYDTGSAGCAATSWSRMLARRIKRE